MSQSRIVVAVLFLLPFIFLFSRQHSLELAPECLFRLTFAQVANSTHICDTTRMTAEMEHLDHFINEPNQYRSRVVYILTGATLASVLQPVAVLIRKFVIEGRVSGPLSSQFVRRFPDYFALIVINFLVLATACWMLQRIVGEPGYLVLGLQAAVTTSDLVNGMFWSQHSNFLNLLVPIGFVFYFTQGMRIREMRLTKIAICGGAAAAGVLSYAYACLWLPAFVLGAIYRDWWMRAVVKPFTADLLLRLFVFAIAGCGPVLTWLAINFWYFHYTVASEAEDMRQFVWILDAWDSGKLADNLAAHGQLFVHLVSTWLGWPALIAASFATSLAIWGGRAQQLRIARDPIIVAVVLTIISMLTFNYMQGFYVPRLVLGIMLALFIAIARAAQVTGRRREGACILMMFAVAQVIASFLWPPLALS